MVTIGPPAEWRFAGERLHAGWGFKCGNFSVRRLYQVHGAILGSLFNGGRMGLFLQTLFGYDSRPAYEVLVPRP